MEKKSMMGWSVVLALAAIVVMVVSSANCVQTSITCPEAIDTIMPCKPFLVDGEDNPTPMCCKGLKRVKDMAITKPDRQLLCECFKQTGPAMGVNPKKAEALPGLCQVKFPFPIKFDIDCKKIAY
ncbi:hypothetical protein EZV62_004616 [Acer yangbiense]|uniref:Non-specific lipid-transfer protein n=1 Tax=Acer yangbiense TaxID=1000413 RepID=A0A5C7IKE3_9ROSI|nr:hypothetical protein EZV62_004616 [Acer yangbiense]